MPHGKAKLREQMRRRLTDMPESERAKASAAICQTVANLPAWRAARVVMCYVSMATEVQTGRLIELAWSQRKRVLAPHVDWDKKVMTAQPLDSWEGLAVGKYGTMQSSAVEPADPETIDLVLAPGLAFDRAGNRLGRGGGFFDRFLPLTRATVAGLCFSCQFIDEVPCSAGDVPVDLVVTELETIQVRPVAEVP